MVQAQQGLRDFAENMEALKHNLLLARGTSRSVATKTPANWRRMQLIACRKQHPQGVHLSGEAAFRQARFGQAEKSEIVKRWREFLANNQFGFAVIVASSGMEGDTQKDLVLTQARAMVVREYLVENFGFDDSQLRLWEWANRPTRVRMPAGVRCRSSSIQLEPRCRRTSKYRPRFNPKQPPTNRSRLRQTQNRTDRGTAVTATTASVTVRKSW